MIEVRHALHSDTDIQTNILADWIQLHHWSKHNQVMLERVRTRDEARETERERKTKRFGADYCSNIWAELLHSFVCWFYEKTEKTNRWNGLPFLFCFWELLFLCSFPVNLIISPTDLPSIVTMIQWNLIWSLTFFWWNSFSLCPFFVYHNFPAKCWIYIWEFVFMAFVEATWCK